MHRSIQLLGTAVFAGAAFAAGLIVAGTGDSANVEVEVEPTVTPVEETEADSGAAGVEQPATTAPATAGPTSTIAEPQPYPTTAPTTTAAPIPDPVEQRELLTQEFVDALNAGDLERLLALSAADPRADAAQLESLIDFAPFWFEECFEVGGGVPKCNATSEGFGLTLGFTDDDSAIGAVDGAYNDGL